MERNVPKLRFKGFNDEWKELKVSDTLKIKHGKDQKEIICDNGEYPILATGGEIGRTNTPIYDKESVLIGRKGTIDRPMYMSTPFWTVDTLFYSQVYEKYVAKFIYYKFQCINWKKYSEASGVPSLSASTIENIKYNIPSLQEQERIANFLTKVDKIIEKQDEKVKNLEKYKKGIMQKIFSQEIRFKDENGEEYPEWEEKKLGDVCEIYGRIGFRGYTVEDIVSKEEGIVSLSPSNILNSKLYMDGNNTYISKTKYEESPEIKIFNGDIIFVKTASIGRTALVLGLQEKATINPQLVVFKNMKMSPKVLSEILTLPVIQKQVNQAKGGGVIPTLTQKDLANYKFYAPTSNKEQNKIADILTKIDFLLKKENEKLEKLKNLKKGLLQQMFV